MRPPRLARLLLRAVRRGRRDELETDLGELFERRLAARGPAYARRRYWSDVVSLFVSNAGRPPAQSPHRLPGKERGPVMSGFLFDLRQVFRAASRQRAFFVVAALTLGVGFAAHLSAFSLVDRLLLSAPAHVQEASRVARLHVDRGDVRGGRFLWFQTPYRSYTDLRTSVPAFAGMAAYRTSTASVGSGRDARQVSVVFADHHYFPLLGVTASLGRVFTEADDRPPSGEAVAVLSDGYWRSTHGGDPAILGRTLRIGAKQYTVIGVAPPGFTGDTPDQVDVWAPFHAGAYEMTPVWSSSLMFRSVSVLVRLSPGIAPSAAAEQATAAYRRLVTGTPAADPTAFIVLASLLPGRAQRGELTQAARIALWIQGVAFLVLLVAVANVVNLQMSRAAQRRRELAVRVALGAGRGRLMRQLALEMLLIASAGATIGVALTYATATSLHQLLLPDTAGVIDGSRLGMMTVSALVASALICVAFASLQVRVEAAAERLKTGRGGDGFSRARLRQGLLVAQVVMSALLLVGAGLFLRSVDRLGRLQFGHDQEQVLVVTLPLRGAGYANDAIERFYDRAIGEVAAVPGVQRVAAAHSTPFAPSQSSEIFVPGRDRLAFELGYPTFYTVTPGFFETMGMRVLRGRGFTADDRTGSMPVILVEEALAKALWPGEDAIGKCFSLATASNPCRTVVGVTSNTRRFVSRADGALRYYVPMGQRVVNAPPQALFVRVPGRAATAIPSVRQALLDIDANIPFAQIRPLEELAEPEKRPWRLGSTVFMVFGAAALFVATAGVYALLSFIVTQRSREIGVRLALGASPRRTVWLIVRQSLGWIVAGLAIGMIAALAAGRFIQPLLFETSPYDAPVFAGTTALLLLVAIAASVVPAVRASRVDPNITLRAE